MEYKKIGFFILAWLCFMSSVYAIDVGIKKETINEVIIKELDNQAVFKLILTNFGEAERFQIYTLVGVELTPRESFILGKNATEIKNIKVKALDNVKKRDGFYTFEYYIKGSEEEISDKLTIKLVSLKDALGVSSDSLDLESNQITIYLQNRENFEFTDMGVEFSSAFFNFEETVSLKPLEKRTFTIDLNKEGFESLIAGHYILSTNISIGGVEEEIEGTINFVESSDITETRSKKGLFIIREEIEKKNQGNSVVPVEITLKRSIFSRFFTTFNIEPTKSERKGISVLYSWQQNELKPGESFKVVAKTNWFIPIVILIAIIVLVILARIYLTSNVSLKKKINLVKTKGGEFALKVTISVRARKFVEKINVIDKLPSIFKLYERYGAIAPDRVDEKNKKIEWNIRSLAENEETTLSYIIYSKIKIVGKFELPSAKAIYDREGKIKETSSNQVFFVSEPEKIKKTEY